MSGKRKQLTITITMFSIIAILAAVVVVGTPYIFVRILNLILVMVAAGVIGACIREAFIRPGTEDPQNSAETKPKEESADE